MSRLLSPSNNWKKLTVAIGTLLALIAASVYSPSLRHVLLYNMFPLCCIGCAIIFCGRYFMRGSSLRIVALLTVLAACFNVYNCICYGVRMEFDSVEYFSLAQSIAAGNGLSHTVYRTPLYPALVGLFMLCGDHAGLFTVIFQHVLVILCVPGIYWISRMFGFSQEASCIASGLIAFNALLTQAAGYMMTEILFYVLALLSLALLFRLCKVPSPRNAVVAAAAFAATTYCRPLLAPLFVAGLVLFCVKSGKRGVHMSLIAVIVYAGATAPWCLRNYISFGHYAMSASFGVQAFTKAFTFGCLDRNGRFYKTIEMPLVNCMDDLKIPQNRVPITAEDDWQTNRLPHALMDSLVMRHGYSFFAASDLLSRAAFEGFTAHPRRYSRSVVASLLTLAFSHREMVPGPVQLVPLQIEIVPLLLRRIAQGMVYVSGYFLLLFPIVIVIRDNRSRAIFIPFAIVCCMYGITAMIQVGLTRYELPWEPPKAMCAAYVIESVVYWVEIIVRKKKAIPSET